MRNPNLFRGFTLLLLLPIVSSAVPVAVRVLGTPAVGQALKVEVSSPGDVGVENPLAKQSQLLKGQGPRVHDLGIVKAPGFYSFRFFTQDRAENVLVPVLGTTGYVSTPVKRAKVQEDALLKFARLHSKDPFKPRGMPGRCAMR